MCLSKTARNLTILAVSSLGLSKFYKFGWCIMPDHLLLFTRTHMTWIFWTVKRLKLFRILDRKPKTSAFFLPPDKRHHIRSKYLRKSEVSSILIVIFQMKGCHTKERITLNPKQILEEHVTQTHDPNQGRDVEHGAGRGDCELFSPSRYLCKFRLRSDFQDKWEVTSRGSRGTDTKYRGPKAKTQRQVHTLRREVKKRKANIWANVSFISYFSLWPGRACISLMEDPD